VEGTIPRDVVAEMGITEDMDMNVFVREGVVVMEPTLSRWDRLVSSVRVRAAEMELSEADVDEAVAMALAEEIALFAQVMPLMVASGTWVSDAGDGPVIEAAIVGGATHTVTGDLRIHQAQIEGFEVIMPAEAPRVAEEHEVG
jgi:antitoxin component of MazEF toxin-antitoxin module